VFVEVDVAVIVREAVQSGVTVAVDVGAVEVGKGPNRAPWVKTMAVLV
jgi:hypothetical protein